ncbi:CoA transferase [Novosphingobium bradum]|uniref:CoA transferase n=1 Tax=Novosphingobium bradum TaxID=1737444 RepID=A0ABV7IP14_9SPHN
MQSNSGTETYLDGVRVVEMADEQAEYCGLLLAGLGAEVVKVEPRDGAPTRAIGPFYEDVPDPERSLHFWTHNRAKRSLVLDPEVAAEREALLGLLARADVFLVSGNREQLDRLGLSSDELAARFPHLIVARMSPFGDTGPWKDYKASDLVHLALGGPMMNCGYDPRPDGEYDTPPIAGQLWHAYYIAGEQFAMGILGALIHQRRTGRGQYVSCAVHDAVSKNTELDLMNWVMRRAPLFRQTCRHAAEKVSVAPFIANTKDGRWIMTFPFRGKGASLMGDFAAKYGIPSNLDAEADKVKAGGGREIPGSNPELSEVLVGEVGGRIWRKFLFDDAPWREGQEIGLLTAPLRKPHDNVADAHWWERKTYAEVDHPELGKSFTYVTGKWLSTASDWVVGRRAPLLDEDRAEVLADGFWPARPAMAKVAASAAAPAEPRLSARGKPFPLQGVRICDFTWFLASAGAMRFLAAFGAESIKIEWKGNPDTRMGAFAPVGGREARRNATGPLPGIVDENMGGQFNNKNPGKLGISLNVRHPEGMEIARRIVGISDIVAEGFSPGVMDKWGLGYDALRQIREDIIYVQQSGMGSKGRYGRFRALGPIAGALAGTSEMSGLPEPAMPAGWGYSYLDWMGAYSMAVATMAAIFQRDRTGKGQHIDASQCESGIFLTGVPTLDWSANGREWRRFGNRSPYKPAAPHGAYRCQGTDRWLTIACFGEAEWQALVRVAGDPDWARDPRFATLAARLAHQDTLDKAISGWTAQWDAYALMHALQGAGVAAGVCQTAEDRCDHDPQLAALEWLTEVTGTKIGTWPVAEVPVKLSETPTWIGGPTNRGAPCYGEDNEYVYGDLLGMSSGEIGRLVDQGII